MRVAEPLRIAIFALALAGCAHAKTTEPIAPEVVAPEVAKKPSSTARAPHTDMVRVAPTGDQPETTPLAAAPEGLLVPGAEQRIHDKLSARGFVKEDANASTEVALRRFQAAHDLPSTGVPDHETVRKLGLNPDDLFRKAAR